MPEKTADVSLANERACNVFADTIDFRDRVYEPSLIQVPPARPLEQHLAGYPEHCPAVILDQGKEGACTGFALATVAHYLLRAGAHPDDRLVSPRMFYEMAKRYDEIPGEEYEGSNARAAMKGWQKHGVCNWELWPYEPNAKDRALTQERVEDALYRPLGAYYRVNHKDLVSIHCALNDVGILYATSIIHEGWNTPFVNGRTGRTQPGEIPFQDGRFDPVGGHAFAIVGYTDKGLWIQNSWGEQWGHKGFGLINYEDWLTNSMDVWVARLGAPVVGIRMRSASQIQPGFAISSDADLLRDIRPHMIRLGNNGRLMDKGTYGSSDRHIDVLLREDIPRITKNWKKDKLRILLYAHGGLVNESAAIQRLGDYRRALLDAQVYPISFIWKTGFWDTVTNVLSDAQQGLHMAEGVFSPVKDMLFDRIDDTLERLSRPLGRVMWDEMKENALLASTDKLGGVRLFVKALADFKAKNPSLNVEVHLLGHSAGSIFLAPMLFLLEQHQIAVKNCILWAPACTMKLFRNYYQPAIESKHIQSFSLFTLTEQAELDDECRSLYHKSLLYLVSNAFEETPRGGDSRCLGEPLLGMERYLRQDADILRLHRQGRINWILSPNTHFDRPADFSQSKQHGAFDDDHATVQAALARILNDQSFQTGDMHFKSTKSILQERRQNLERYNTPVYAH